MAQQEAAEGDGSRRASQALLGLPHGSAHAAKCLNELDEAGWERLAEPAARQGDGLDDARALIGHVRRAAGGVRETLLAELLCDNTELTAAAARRVASLAAAVAQTAHGDPRLVEVDWRVLLATASDSSERLDRVAVNLVLTTEATPSGPLERVPLELSLQQLREMREATARMRKLME